MHNENAIEAETCGGGFTCIAFIKRTTSGAVDRRGISIRSASWREYLCIHVTAAAAAAVYDRVRAMLAAEVRHAALVHFDILPA